MVAGPVILSSHDGHGCGPTPRPCGAPGSIPTTDPEGGRIETRQRGEPTGCCSNAPSMPSTPSSRVRDPAGCATRCSWQQRLLSVGITGWQDAGVGIPAFGLTDTLDTYLAADAAGELVAHVCGALWWTAEVPRRSTPSSNGAQPLAVRALHIDTVKVMQDGSARTAPPPCWSRTATLPRAYTAGPVVHRPRGTRHGVCTIGAQRLRRSHACGG